MRRRRVPRLLRELLVVTVVVVVVLRVVHRRDVTDTTPHLLDYEAQVRADEAQSVPGLGALGHPASLPAYLRPLGMSALRQWAVNVPLSDRIPYNRTLTDYRHPACKRVVYDAELPSASVIVIFHNEPYSVVVRTVWSVLNSARRDRPWFQSNSNVTLGYSGQEPNSPFVYLKEIILVDDDSTLPELKGKLGHYVSTRMPPDMIRIVRLGGHVGLTRARLVGSRFAAGDVLVFLDAHCEVQPDWLRPLLQRVKDSPRTVVTPIIDILKPSDFQYVPPHPWQFQVAGFTFLGEFSWIDVPEHERKRRRSDIAPTWSPTMAGGLFAIGRLYYWELGAYDEQMAGWGGENLEMSFRIWQCGGTLETLPCSRVGHMFRLSHGEDMLPRPDTHGINTARMAEAWMDEYKEVFYLYRPDLRNNPKIGDITHRRVLREKLQCKSFQWYLDHVYKEKFVPVRDAYGYGRFQNPSSGLCLDTLQREESSPLGVYPCHETLQGTQFLSLTVAGQLRDEERCLDLLHCNEDNIDTRCRPLMVPCHDSSSQLWKYLATKQLKHVDTQMCLEASFESGTDVWVRRCEHNDSSQHWEIDYSKENDFRRTGDVRSSEQEFTLQKLRSGKRATHAQTQTRKRKPLRRVKL